MQPELGFSQVVAWLIAVPVIVAILIAVLAFVLWLGRRWASEKPEDVLRSRFAHGEMTQAEFDTAMSDLAR
jgi:uncharacterized membrane protein